MGVASDCSGSESLPRVTPLFLCGLKLSFFFFFSPFEHAME